MIMTKMKCLAVQVAVQHASSPLPNFQLPVKQSSFFLVFSKSKKVVPHLRMTRILFTVSKIWKLYISVSSCENLTPRTELPGKHKQHTNITTTYIIASIISTTTTNETDQQSPRAETR